jgi:hypothetical protein
MPDKKSKITCEISKTTRRQINGMNVEEQTLTVRGDSLTEVNKIFKEHEHSNKQS